MKTKIILLILIVGFSLKAQEPSKGAHLFSVSFVEAVLIPIFSPLYNLSFVYEYEVFEKVSIGGILRNVNLYDIALGIRGSYYLHRWDSWDAYTGCFLGGLFNLGKTVEKVPSMGLYFGGRYFFSNFLAANIEIGYLGVSIEKRYYSGGYSHYFESNKITLFPINMIGLSMFF